MEKWKFLDQSHGLTPLQKCQFLDFLNFLFFWPRKAFFSLEYSKRHFTGLYCLKEKVEKWWFLDQNHGLTPLEKCPFFNFLNLFFYSLERRFFVLEYRKGHFPMLYCRKKKMEKWSFSGQHHGLLLLEKCQFFDFSNYLFV